MAATAVALAVRLAPQAAPREEVILYRRSLLAAPTVLAAATPVT